MTNTINTLHDNQRTLLLDKYLHLITSSLNGSLDTEFPDNWQFSVAANSDIFWKALKNSTMRTMLGRQKLENIRSCVEYVIKNKIRGDFFEAGCWRGGGVIYMKACLSAYEAIYEDTTLRKLIGADLFPENRVILSNPLKRIFLKLGSHLHYLLPPKIKQYIANELLTTFPSETYESSTLTKIMYLGRKLSWWKSITLPNSTSTDLMQAFKRYQLWDQRIILKSGWFEDSFASIQIDELAILRVDADFYSSTKLTLETFYHKLTPGGFCIIDDYHGFDECRKAVDEYRSKNNIDDELLEIDGVAVYWQKKG